MDLHSLSGRRQLCALLLATLLGVAPLVALRQGLVMAPLAGLAGLAALGAREPAAPWRRVFVPWLWWLAPFVALLAWAGLSGLWSIDPAASRAALFTTAGSFAAALAILTGMDGLADDARERCFIAAAAGLAATAAILIGTGAAVRAELAPASWRGPFVGMDRASTIVAVMVWPVAAFLARRGQRGRATLLVAISLAGVLLAYDLAAKLALVAGALFFVLAARLGRVAVVPLVVFAVAAALLAPLAAGRLPAPEVTATWGGGLPTSFHHRLTIWSFAAERLADRPWMGTGMDSSRSQPGGKTNVLVKMAWNCPDRSAPWTVGPISAPTPPGCQSSPLQEEQMPLHPHDWWLQAWLELGAVGALLMAGLMAGLGHLAANGPVRPPAAAILAATLVIGSVSFGLWQAWWLCSLALAAGLCVALPAWRD